MFYIMWLFNNFTSPKWKLLVPGYRASVTFDDCYCIDSQMDWS